MISLWYFAVQKREALSSPSMMQRRRGSSAVACEPAVALPHGEDVGSTRDDGVIQDGVACGGEKDCGGISKLLSRGDATCISYFGEVLVNQNDTVVIHFSTAWLGSWPPPMGVRGLCFPQPALSPTPKTRAVNSMYFLGVCPSSRTSKPTTSLRTFPNTPFSLFFFSLACVLSFLNFLFLFLVSTFHFIFGLFTCQFFIQMVANS